MKAILCRTLGPPESLELADLPEPQPGPGEVLVHMRAAALNFFDTLIIEGRYQRKPALPFSPAGEGAGVVASVGADVDGFAPGDRVLFHVGHGAARERVLCRATRCVGLPDALSFEAAAGLGITYGTALHAFRQRALLKPGERVAVLGASGGAGLAAVEIASLMGAQVVACASSSDKVAFAMRHGAALGFDYGSEDMRQGLKALAGEAGIDVIFDTVGGALSEPAFRSLGWGGRHLVVGFAAGDIPRIALNLPLVKGASIVGVEFTAFCDRQPEAAQANLADILDWAAAGKLSAHVDAVYPLERTGEALRRIANREARGKIVVVPGA